MADSTAHLVTMANDIANNLAPGKLPDEAAIATANHMRMFWSPAMRAQLLTRTESRAHLNTIAQAASQLLEAKL